MKILELCPFSKGICGVWTRVYSESLEFQKLGHEVLIFSSNLEKGTNNKVELKDQISGIQIKRYPTKNSYSENVKFWFSKKTLIDIKNYNPDIIITHLLHPHSEKLSKKIPLLKKLNPDLKVFLVTHAPFNVKRKFPLNILTKIHRTFFKINYKYFNKIIAITNWEIPYLINLKIPKSKILYLPNGIPEEFFIKKNLKPQNDVLFLGRIAPVKNIELLIESAKKLPNISFSVVGPKEEKYFEKLNKLSKGIKNINFYPPITNLHEKIKLIDNHKIFVLPSSREAMPQVLIEAMSRGKIVISSNTEGGKEIIKNNFNGFLFNINDSNSLTNLITKNINGNSKIQKNAIISSEKYNWKNLIKLYQKEFK